jgi:hypothetical protein
MRLSRSCQRLKQRKKEARDGIADSDYRRVRARGDDRRECGGYIGGMTVHLVDLCELIVDCEHKTAPTQEAGHPSIRTPNIGNGRLILDNANRVSEETYRLWTQRAVPRAGDLIMAREAPVGKRCDCATWA